MKPVGKRFKDFRTRPPSRGTRPSSRTPTAASSSSPRACATSCRTSCSAWRHEDDEVLFDQVISDQTKQEFQGQGKDPHEVVEFLKTNRADIGILFSRMPFGEQSPNVIIQQPARRTMLLEVTGLAAKDLKYTELWAVMEKGNWKLLWIK